MRFILLLIAAAVVVYVAVIAVQLTGAANPGSKPLVALPEWMAALQPAHKNETSASQENKAPEATSSETAASETPSANSAPAQTPSTETHTAANATPQEAPATVDVIVARDTIPMGTTLDASMIETQAWPVKLLPKHYMALETVPAQGSATVEKHNKETMDKVVGKLVRSTFQAHEPIIMSKLADPSDRNFLAGELAPGMRAITIPVDSVSGVAGYVYPGDRVDVVFTHNVPQEMKNSKTDYKNTAFYRPTVAEVIVPNVRVLAINTRTKSDKDDVAPPTNVTIETSDEAAQRIRLAERLGILTLSLRSSKDTNNTVVCPTHLKDLSKGDTSCQPERIKIVEKKKAEPSVEIIRGAAMPVAPCTNNPCVIH